MKKSAEIEKRTGELYSACFEPLNAVDEHWFAHGRLLAQQLSIREEDIRGQKMLDGGCGNGTLTYRLLEMGAGHVTAIDLKPTPKQEVFDAYRGRVEFLTASLLSLPFPDQTFDSVASTGVLQHTADPEKALAEMIRVLKPGGRLYLGVYGKHGLFSWLLSAARVFTVQIPLIRQDFVDSIIARLRFSPLVRYQIIDYLFVPNILRSSPTQLKHWFTKYGMRDPRRVYNVSVKEASDFRHGGTVYTYDPRTLTNRILFGYGFINMQADK